MLRVVRYPAAVLSRKVDRVEQFDATLRELVTQMAECMYASKGVGLAAPQVNVARRLLLIDPTGGDDSNQLVPMINPEVTWRSAEVEVGDEGCLSLPGVGLRVPRSIAVHVDYCDVDGVARACQLAGFPARIVQHEVDHLDGVTMLDRVGRHARRAALKDLGRKR